MAARTTTLRRVGAVVDVLSALALLAGGVWAYVTFIDAPDVETLRIAYEGEQTIDVLSPRWLGLALIVPFVWLVRRFSLSDLPFPQRLANAVLRTALFIALALALAEVVITDYDSQVATVILVDVSESVPDSLLEAAQDYAQRVWDERQGNAVRLVTFARDAVELPIAPGSQQIPSISRHEGPGAGLESNLGPALRLAYGLFPQDHLQRAVIISDGNLNRGDSLSEAYQASRYGIRLYSAELEYERADEVLIRGVDFPSDIRANEPFHITVDVFSTYDGEVLLDMTQNEYRDVRGRAYPVRAGVVSQLDILAEVYEPGRRQFDIEIRPDVAERDRFADNNAITHVVEVEGRPQVLYVEGNSRSSSYLERALDDERNSRVDFDLEVRSSSGMPDDLDELQRFDLVIASDVPARSMSRATMAALRTYVRDGGGFLMVGGEDSLGPGGYRGTTIEELLPVTFETRRTSTMPSVALMLVIDRSGSMEGLNLEMAKDAARAAVEMLGPQDQVGVIAFDSSPRTIVRMQSASNRTRIESDIGRITPGGGTEIYPALEEAYFALLERRARIRHVILLSDGAAPYSGIAELAGLMRSDRITVSTVGLGAEADHTLLEMISDITGGRSYFTSSASSIPQIFVQDTTQMTRSSVVEEPFRPVLVESSTATSGIDFASVPYLLGYVSTRAKSGATVSLETEQGEPLYAYWRQGRGLAAVWTSDCKNRWMAEWVRDPVYGRFWAQVARHLMRRRAAESDDALELRTWVEDGRGRVQIDVVSEADRFVNGLESTIAVTGPGEVAFEVPLRQTAAGRYEGDFALPAYGSYLLEGNHELAGESYARSLASLANPYPDEYLEVRDDQSAIRQAVALADGRIDPAPAELFDPGDERIESDRELWPYFLFAALALLLVDVLLRRIRLFGRTTLQWGSQA
jgi:Ca-activated chloride channel family protein